jgi:hypothetical protein
LRARISVRVGVGFRLRVGVRAVIVAVDMWIILLKIRV